MGCSCVNTLLGIVYVLRVTCTIGITWVFNLNIWHIRTM